MSEQVCGNCGKVNPESESYCTACGHALSGERTVASTQPLNITGLPQPQLRWGTAFFEDRMILQLEIKGTDQMIQHELGLDCVVGRTHEDVVPDLDLAPFNALEHGVSRRHARLTRQSLTVMVQDLGSVNGTFLNGTRLVPFQPRVLRHDDELVLGRLALRVSFLRGVVARPEPGGPPQQEVLASEEPLISPPGAPLQVSPPEPVVSPQPGAAQPVTPSEALASEEPLISPPGAPLQVSPPEPVVSPQPGAAQPVSAPEKVSPPSPPDAKRDTDELNDAPAEAAPGPPADPPPTSETP